MKKKETDKIYLNPAWIKFSKIKKKRNPFCEVCDDPTKVIHHKVPIKNGGKLLSNSNTIALCSFCHQQAHLALKTEIRGL